MDRMIVFAGASIMAPGVGFLLASELIPTLHSAYVLGDYLWLTVGGVTATVGYKVNHKKLEQRNIGTVR